MNSFCQGQGNYPDLIHQARKMVGKGDLSKGKELYEKAFALTNSPLKGDLYDLACCEALLGNNELSFKYLTMAVGIGFRSRGILSDKDLQSLPRDENWNRIIQKVEKNRNEFVSGLDSQLVRELAEIFENDQRFRKDLQELYNTGDTSIVKKITVSDSIEKYDSVNLEKINKIIQKNGWPGIDLVGETGNNAVFFVVQHASDSVQKKYLPLLESSIAAKQSPAYFLAYLRDRMLVRANKKQVYGTQVDFNSKTKRYELSDIENWEEADRLRHELGMISLRLYLEDLNSNL